MKIQVLRAFNGDSILLSFEDEGVNKNILIDGGIGRTYKEKGKKGKIEYNDLFNTIQTIRDNGEKIDLLILTHIDDDHIGGILKWFTSDDKALESIDKIWFNSGKTIQKFIAEVEEDNNVYTLEIHPESGEETSVKQGVTFESIIEKKNGLWDKKVIIAGDEIGELNLKFTILSPGKSQLEKLLKAWGKEQPESLETSGKHNDYELSLADHLKSNSWKEDNAIPNGSSIAFLMAYKEKSLLFLGDSHPSVIVESLKEKFAASETNRIKAEVVKLSHHGSAHNNNLELLSLIDCDKFIVSTNGDKHFHPHKFLLAHLINQKPNCHIYFNYPELLEQIFTEEDYKDFPHFKAMGIDNGFTIN